MGFAVVSCCTNVSALAQAPSALPKVWVVVTGGTIAGEQQEPGTLAQYDVKKSVNDIVASVPNVRRYAKVEMARSRSRGMM